MGTKMTQEAPVPTELFDLVSRVRYRPGWKFHLGNMDRGQGSKGLTLDIITLGYNSYHPEQGEHYSVHHYMIVPAASFDRRSWQRWLFEQVLLVERHEAMEFFQIVYADDPGGYVKRDGSVVPEVVDRPYAPHHGPGNDPYIVFEHGTDEDVRTSFRGEVKS